jgi:hypothetical protein
MDKAVAELVMGWHVETENEHTHWITSDDKWGAGIGKYPEYDDEFLHTLDFHPSESLLWAWEVVEKMQGGLRFELRRIPSGFWEYFGEEMSAEANTAPLAISRAALLAVRGA